MKEPKKKIMKCDFVELLWLWGESAKWGEKRRGDFILLDLWEAGLLYEYALEQSTSKVWHGLESQVILEIGRYWAGSTVLLATATHGSRVKVISVDVVDLDDETSQYVDEWLNEYEEKERIDIRTENSYTMKNVPLSMLFVDGDHTYDGIKKDFLHHWNYLHGPCLCHDYTDPTTVKRLKAECPGVTKFIDEWIEEGYAEIIEQKQTMIVLKKLKNYEGGRIGKEERLREKKKR